MWFDKPVQNYRIEIGKGNRDDVPIVGDDAIRRIAAMHQGQPAFQTQYLSRTWDAAFWQDLGVLFGLNCNGA